MRILAQLADGEDDFRDACQRAAAELGKQISGLRRSLLTAPSEVARHDQDSESPSDRSGR
jgi:hypothetical protein